MSSQQIKLDFFFMEKHYTPNNFHKIHDLPLFDHCVLTLDCFSRFGLISGLISLD